MRTIGLSLSQFTQFSSFDHHMSTKNLARSIHIPIRQGFPRNW